MKHTYFNRYPETSKVLLSDQSMNHAFLQDFDQGMQAAGLIRTTNDDQLDLNNIPNISNLHDYHIDSQSSYAIRFTYAPLIYTFNDELNSEYPLYLYFYFHYATVMPMNDAHKTGKSCNFILGVQLEIRDNNGIIRTPKSYIGSIPYTSSSFTFSGDYIIPIHNKNKSKINNIDNKLLYLSICPGTFYKHYKNLSVPGTYGSTSNSTYNYGCFINFIFRRYENGHYLFISNANLYVHAPLVAESASYQFTKNSNYPSIQYNNSDNHILNSVTFFSNSYVSMADFYNAKKLYAFPLEYYVPGGDDKMISDDLLLVGNSKLFPESINALININMDEYITKKYAPLSTGYTSMKLNADSDITLLMAEE